MVKWVRKMKRLQNQFDAVSRKKRKEFAQNELQKLHALKVQQYGK